MTDTPHNNIFTQLEHLTGMKHSMRSLANACWRLGMEQMAQELSEFCVIVETATTEISGSVAEIGKQRLHDAQSTTATMLQALVAGAKIAKDNPDAGDAIENVFDTKG